MHKDEFAANLAVVKKRKILMIRVALSILFVLLATSMYMNKVHPKDGVRSVFLAVCMVGYPAVVYLCITSVQRLGRRLGLHCPHCGRSLSGPLAHKVVESGTCLHCGNYVF